MQGGSRPSLTPTDPKPWGQEVAAGTWEASVPVPHIRWDHSPPHFPRFRWEGDANPAGSCLQLPVPASPGSREGTALLARG